MLTLLLISSVKTVLGDSITRIHNADEFITFAKNVNIRTSYSGTTVFLDSDLSFYGKSLELIDYFRGVFDGQGHIISNLKMNSSTSRYTGLFGNSYGLTICNVVLDSSCSITNSLSGSNNVYIGGIIRKCYSSNGQCIIENVVNMADVTISGSTNYNLFIGGIAGYLYSSSHPIYVKNCANYGSITRSGTSGNSLIGGIVGYSERSSSSSSSYTSIQNCVNYGAITHSGTSTNVHIGGIVGYSYFIHNCVNYGAITHNGTSTNVYIGGIVGSSNSYTSIQNCVNYGTITHNGSSTGNLDIGGIAGYSYSYIQNCLNYGTITYNGSSGNPHIGGIVGYGYSSISVQNCLSAGKISTLTTASGDSYIGSIVGRVNSYTHINYCYYTSDVNASSIYGTGTPESTSGTPDTPTNVDSELVSKLNSNATSRNWDKWFILHLNGGSINNLAQDPLIGIQGHIPNPVKEGNSFLFWCKDAEFTEEFNPQSDNISEITDLYAAWVNNTVIFDFDNGTTVNETFSYNTEIIYPKREGYTLSWDNYHELMPAKDITVTSQRTPNNYTVTFDFDNGTTVNETFSYNTEIIYPDMKKEGYTLYWDNYHQLMPARDITVTVQWIPNNYTVTFDANGGNISTASMIVTFNSTYRPLPTPTKEGYMFLGWSTDNNVSVKNETIVTTTHNHTLHAQWVKVTNQVEIVFDAKDLTEGEVEELVRKYTDAEFAIVEYENGNDSSGVRVIVKFADNEGAKNFVETIKDSSEMDNIKKISFVSGEAQSVSPMLCPILFFNNILFII